MATKTIVDFANLIKDYTKKLVHWGDQSKGYVGKNLGQYIKGSISGNDQTGYSIDTSNATAISLIAKIENNKNYIASKSSSVGNRFRIVLFTNYPPIDSTGTNNATQLINDVTKHEYTFNSGNYNYAVLTCNYNETYSGELEGMIRLASITDSTYEPWYISNRELTDVIDIYNSLTFNTQTHYSLDEKSFKKCGNQIHIRLRIKSLDIDSYPSGQSWTKIASGLPIPALGETKETIMPTTNGKPLEYGVNGHDLSVRGGTTNCFYDVYLIYNISYIV